MNPLSSSLESIILSYRVIACLTTVLSHIWTWVAILTAAAISLWRIKAVAASSCQKIQLHSPKGVVAQRNPQNGHRRQTRPSHSQPFDSASNTILEDQSENQSVPRIEAVGFQSIHRRKKEGERKLRYKANNSPTGILKGMTENGDYVGIMSETKRVGCHLCDDQRSKKLSFYFEGQGRQNGDDEIERIVKEYCFTDTIHVERRESGGSTLGSVTKWPWYTHQNMDALNGNVVRLWPERSSRVAILRTVDT